MPMGRILREQPDSLSSDKAGPRFLQHAGATSGPPDRSSRKGFSQEMKGIADTALVVACGNRDDGHRSWAVDAPRTLTELLLSCEAMLAESALHPKLHCVRPGLECRTECCGSHLIAPGIWSSYVKWQNAIKIASEI
jgi:hypothetical protein